VENRTDLTRLALADVAQRCAQETARFFQRRSYDSTFCYELFRRAILDGSESAWELIYTQYDALVTGWVRRHPAFPASGEEADYFVNHAFERFWTALPRERFAQFSNLPALLRYLQMCVHSAVLDYVRTAEQAAVSAQKDVEAAADPAAATQEDELLSSAHREEFWREIGKRLHDEKERCVVYGSFVLALKPRELYARFPGTFRDVQEVYGIKENVLTRLGRDAELRRLLGPDD
jgi:hypothetical protein